jgi:glc operon protein GlcG
MRSVVAFGLALGAVVLFGRSAEAQLLEKKGLSLEAARKMVAAAEAEAERNDWRGVVAVVDDGGWIILLERMDHAAMTASVELAPGKARTAALFKKPSQALEETINRGRYAAITARGFIEMQGALPVVVDGEVIGAIGASFATPEEDEQVAKAGLAALSQ